MSQLRLTSRARATAILGSFAILVCVDQATASATPSSFFSTVGLGPMTTVRQEAAAAALPDGKVLIAGGLSNANAITILSSAEVFDPSTGAFSSAGVGPMTTARIDAAAAPLPDGRVLIAGGADATSNALSSAELFDPATGTFSAAGVGSMTVARAGAAAAPLPDGDVLIAGGDDGHGNALRSAELFDPATDTFSGAGMGSMTTAREFAAAAPLPDGDVLIAGGGGGGGLASAELFDPSTDTFSSAGLGPMTAPRDGATATPLPDGKVLVAGGIDSGNHVLASAELFDPATGAFSSAGVGSMTTGRDLAVAGPLPDGEVLIAGGSDAGNHALASAELFEPAPEAVSAGGDFGEQTVAHPSAVQPLVVTNVGAQALTISGASLGGTDATDFTVTADACAGIRLAFGHSCTITARFTPSTTGGHSAAITLQDNEAAPLTIVLSGTGVAADSGPAGAEGAAGIAGSQGSGGPQGPQGPAGARGPAGQIRLITCRTVTSVIHAHRVAHRKCTTRILSGTATFTAAQASARLVRGRTVYATGSAWLDRMVLYSRRPIGPGSYTLELRRSDGRRSITTRRRITVGTPIAVG